MMTGQRHVVIANNTRHIHGCKVDRPDFRDHHFSIAAPEDAEVNRQPVKMIDLVSPWDTDLGIYDQGDIGACTAHGVVEAFRWVHWKAQQKLPPEQRKPAPDYSRLAQYGWTRLKIEGTPLAEDSGCQIRDSIKCAVALGLSPENLWPYVTSKFDINPPPEAEQAALNHQVVSYHRVPNLQAVKGQNLIWYPVITGFTCFESLQDPTVAQTGIVPIPGPDEKTIGGHCIALVGYDDNIPVGNGQKGGFYFPQSWGRSWGKALGISGWGVLPYWYFTSGMASDSWVIHTVEGVDLP